MARLKKLLHRDYFQLAVRARGKHPSEEVSRKLASRRVPIGAALFVSGADTNRGIDFAACHYHEMPDDKESQ